MGRSAGIFKDRLGLGEIERKRVETEMQRGREIKRHRNKET